MLTFLYVIFIAMIAAALIGGLYMYQQSDELRPHRLLRHAEVKGYGFEENGSAQLQKWNKRCPLFSAGENRMFMNVVYGPYRDVNFTVFDYRFNHGDHIFCTSVLAFELKNKGLPCFSLWPRLMMAPQPVLEPDNDSVALNLDGTDPTAQMQNLYSLHTTCEGTARLLLCPKAVEYLTAHPDFFIEGGGNWIILYQINHRRQPAGIDDMLHTGYQILRALRLNDSRVNFEPDLDNDDVQTMEASAATPGRPA